MSDLPRFSATERLIVEMLAAHEEMFGLQMVEMSGGQLKRGTVYVTLGRMQEKGYLESRQEPLPEGAIGLAAASLSSDRTRDASARSVESGGSALHRRRQSAGGVMAITNPRTRVRIAVV